MKSKQLFVFLLVISVSTVRYYAQPGDRGFRLQERFFRATLDSLKKHPDNLFYHWAWIENLFRPQFTLQTRPAKELKEYLHYSDQYKGYLNDDLHASNSNMFLGNFLLSHQSELLGDLSKLIEADIEFKERFTSGMGGYFPSANKASFLFRRGQLYYVTGCPEKAIQDYLDALNYKPTDHSKREIYLSIAAYYYHCDAAASPENFRTALKYIHLVEPAVEDTLCLNGKMPTYYRYEREKLDLIKKCSDSTRYVNYLQNRSASFLNYYYSLIHDSELRSESNTKEAMALSTSNEYELMIYNYLKEISTEIPVSEFKVHKKIIADKL